VHLAKTLREGCNLLLLDEPSNDLVRVRVRVRSRVRVEVRVRVKVGRGLGLARARVSQGSVS